MISIKHFLNSETQKHYAKAKWSQLRDKVLDPFKGAFYVSLVFGTFSLLTSGLLKQVFENGILEHFAKTTIPLSFLAGITFSGFAVLLRRKNTYLFWLLRHFSDHCLIFTMGLFAILSGLTFGLAVPSMIDGWKNVILCSLIGSIFYAFVIVCHKAILLNYIYYPKSRHKKVLMFGVFLVFVGIMGLFYTLETATSDLVA